MLFDLLTQCAQLWHVGLWVEEIHRAGSDGQRHVCAAVLLCECEDPVLESVAAFCCEVQDRAAVDLAALPLHAGCHMVGQVQHDEGFADVGWTVHHRHLPSAKPAFDQVALCEDGLCLGCPEDLRRWLGWLWRCVELRQLRLQGLLWRDLWLRCPAFGSCAVDRLLHFSACVVGGVSVHGEAIGEGMDLLIGETFADV